MDVVYINGYGFPIWRGVPMQHANMEGLDIISAKIDEFAKNDPEFWQKADLIASLSEIKGRFGDAPALEDRKPVSGFNKSSVAGNL